MIFSKAKAMGTEIDTEQVSKEEWEYVHAYVKKLKKDDQIKGLFKIRRKDDEHKDKIKHSFLVLPAPNFTIVALSNKAILGKGGQGVVKVGELENATQVAVKVTQSTPSQNTETTTSAEYIESIILNELGELVDFVNRLAGKNKSLQKNYIIQDLKEGISLAKMLVDAKINNSLNTEPPSKFEQFGPYKCNHYLGFKSLNLTKKEQKYVLGYKMAKEIKNFHDKNIIHIDLKPDNFMYNFEDNGMVIVKPIDFGLGHKLKPGQKDVRLLFRGSPKYHYYHRYNHGVIVKYHKKIEELTKKIKDYDKPIADLQISLNEANEKLTSLLKKLEKNKEKKLGYEFQQKRRLENTIKLLELKLKMLIRKTQIIIIPDKKAILILKDKIERQIAKIENYDNIALKKDLTRNYSKSTDVLSFGCICYYDLGIKIDEFPILEKMMGLDLKAEKGYSEPYTSATIDEVIDAFRDKIKPFYINVKDLLSDDEKTFFKKDLNGSLLSIPK